MLTLSKICHTPHWNILLEASSLILLLTLYSLQGSTVYILISILELRKVLKFIKFFLRNYFMFNIGNFEHNRRIYTSIHINFINRLGKYILLNHFHQFWSFVLHMFTEEFIEFSNLLSVYIKYFVIDKCPDCDTPIPISSKLSCNFV